MHVVWFKRDLRVRDHRPLMAACRSGEAVLCLYVFETGLWQQPDADARHIHFINQSLRDLQSSLKAIGGQLTVRIGEITDELDAIHAERPITVLHSHEETGTLWSFERDKAVGRWCKARNVRWIEQTQNGVIRRLKTRNGWASQWRRRMNERLQRTPPSIKPACGVDSMTLPAPGDFGLDDLTSPDNLQMGGEVAAHETLKSFFQDRGHNYHREMSSPATAWQGCSRMSPHLAWGTISIAHVYQSLQRQIRLVRQRGFREGEDETQRLTALKAFEERLHWHCHFIQKLEDQPDIENVNMHRSCDGLRPEAVDKRRLDAWKQGRTGYPLVDACMRAVRQTGWLNFRMRAMVVSFASYHLWLDWRTTSRWLARMFTDYEPGIHYSQFQMQSGTTGISTVRIYNPIRQVHDQDLEGAFIRQWVPELARVPTDQIAEPHRMSLAAQQQAGCLIGDDYPLPIVDHSKAYAAAHLALKKVRRSEPSREEARGVLERHGSRRARRPRR